MSAYQRPRIPGSYQARGKTLSDCPPAARVPIPTETAILRSSGDKSSTHARSEPNPALIWETTA